MGWKLIDKNQWKSKGLFSKPAWLKQNKKKNPRTCVFVYCTWNHLMAICLEPEKIREKKVCIMYDFVRDANQNCKQKSGQWHTEQPPRSSLFHCHPAKPDKIGQDERCFNHFYIQLWLFIASLGNLLQCHSILFASDLNNTLSLAVLNALVGVHLISKYHFNLIYSRCLLY